MKSKRGKKRIIAPRLKIPIERRSLLFADEKMERVEAAGLRLRWFSVYLDLIVHQQDAEPVLLNQVLFDTGSALMTIPTKMAEDAGIAFSTEIEVKVSGATGTGTAFLSKIEFSLAGVSEWRFPAACLFNPQLEKPLMSLGEIIRNFRFRQRAMTAEFPYGFVEFELRHDHSGIGVKNA